MPAPEAAKPSLLRAINLRTTFELVHAGGPVAAPHLVRSTGLSKPTVSEVLGQLVDLGLLHRVGRTSGLPGPSAQLYDVNPRAGWVLSLDVGREWVRAALVDLTGAVVGRCAARTPRSTAKAVISQLRRAAETLTGEAGITLDDINQVVVGTPGVLRPGADHLSLAPQLAGWESPKVIPAIREALVAPVVFENDVNMAAVGEHVHGVAQDSDDFVLLSVGTGVGDRGLRRRRAPSRRCRSRRRDRVSPPRPRCRGRRRPSRDLGNRRLRESRRISSDRCAGARERCALRRIGRVDLRRGPPR